MSHDRNHGLREYLKSRGATEIDPKALAEYDREMRETVIPKIIQDLKDNARAVAKIRHKPLFG